MATAAQPRREPLPTYVTPMLAVLGALPLPGADEDWVFERKWDGVRAAIRHDGHHLSLTSRNDLDMSTAYPDLTGLGDQLGPTPVLLDGEIVAFDRDGRPSFSVLQQRMHVRDAVEAHSLALAHPVVLMIFDILHLDGLSLLPLPFTERRAVLEGLDLHGDHWQTPAPLTGPAAHAVATSQGEHLEGVVAKRAASLYQPGRRSPDWTKLKNIRTQEVIIGGWRPGAGNRAGTIGSLLLGLPSADGLRYVGRVGTGFTVAVLTDLTQRLQPISRAGSPFLDVPRSIARDAHWVEPHLVGEVAFAEWTTDERLRQPAWRGLRPDKTPDQVTRES